MRRERSIRIVVLIAFIACWAGRSLAQSASEGDWKRLLTVVKIRFSNVERVTTDKLSEWLKQDGKDSKPLLILDVREPAEYDVSHIEGAVQVDPEASVSSAIAGVSPKQPIVTYCSVGWRSAKFAQRLKKAGYLEVYNLHGSLFKWANEGRPLMRDGQEVAEVHPFNPRWGKYLDAELRWDPQMEEKKSTKAVTKALPEPTKAVTKPHPGEPLNAPPE